MSTVKAVIVPSVSNTLTTAYTNSTGSNATLKAINADGIGDPNNWTVETDQSGEWTYFGTPNQTFIAPQSTTAGNTAPFPIQLSANRVLLLWTPANMHCGGGNDYLGGTVLHTQIVEYTGTKYRAGPIVNLLLPTAAFNSQTVGIWTTPGGMGGSGQTCLRAITISSTKVALAYRVGTGFRLMRLNIVGNSLDQANVVNFDLTGATSFNSTTAFAFDIAPVIGDANQVVVGGSNGTNWSLQAFNVPDTGAITTASSLYNTGLAHTTFHFAMAPLSGTIAATTTTYVVAANTSTGVTLSVQNFSYNSATNAFSVVGTPVTVTNTNTLGVEAKCLSTDGTANAVIAFFNTGATSTLSFLYQTSLTQATNTATTATLPSASATRALKASWNWGTDRAVFLTDVNGLVVFDNTGARTPLVANTDSTLTTASQPLWFPFNSRPLYTFYDTSTEPGRISQYVARTGMTSSTSVGVATFANNYFPYGHPYGGDFTWSTPANCWFVGQGGRIYAISDDGVVLNELNLYNLFPGIGNNAYLLSVKQVEMTPSGKLLFLTDTQGTAAASYYGLYWNSVVATSYGFAIGPVTSAQSLTTAPLLSTPTSFSYQVAIDMNSYVDSSGTERALGLYVQASTNAYVAAVRFDGTTWATVGQTAIANAALSSAFHFGARPNFALVQDSPANAVNPTGLWRVVGATGLDTAIKMAYQGISTTPYSDPAILSTSVNTSLNSSVAAVYPIVKSNSVKSASFAMYDTNALVGRYFFVFEGRLITSLRGITIAGANTMQFMNSIASKYGFVISPCSTNTAAVAQVAYAFDTINPSVGPRYTLTATSGNGWTTLLRTSNTQLNVFGTDVNTRYTVPGPDTAKLNIVVSSGVNDFHVLPVIGQDMDTSISSSYRNGDVYLIPNGYSVKLKSTLPGSVAAMLTVVEDA